MLWELLLDFVGVFLVVVGYSVGELVVYVVVGVFDFV